MTRKQDCGLGEFLRRVGVEERIGQLAAKAWNWKLNDKVRLLLGPCLHFARAGRERIRQVAGKCHRP